MPAMPSVGVAEVERISLSIFSTPLHFYLLLIEIRSISFALLTTVVMTFLSNKARLFAPQKMKKERTQKDALIFPYPKIISSRTEGNVPLHHVGFPIFTFQSLSSFYSYKLFPISGKARLAAPLKNKKNNAPKRMR